MTVQLPENVSKIIDELEKNGFEAYAVGGCVRDSILGRVPDDWDITTSALPEDIKRVFPRTVDTGIEHGTVTVLCDKEHYEVTTFRIDGTYSDNRHPDEVSFTSDLKEDLKRRDFTINAMAYNNSKGLVDEFDGMDDIKRGLVRCVGNPFERFEEDALRIFRAVRFSAQLGFDIEEGTIEAIRDRAETLENISAERIRTELVKLITSDHPEKIRDCYDMGITAVVLPEFDRMMMTPQRHIHHMYNVGEHTIKVMESVSATPVMRLTALLHDVAKPDCKTEDEEGNTHFKGHPEKGAIVAGEILRRLKFDNDTIYKVKNTIKWHDTRPEATEENIRRLLNKTGPEIFEFLMEIKRGDILGQSTYMREEKLATLYEYERLYRKIINEGQCYCVKMLAVDGNDLIEAGVPEGREIGEKLSALLDIVLADQSQNKKEILISLIAEHRV